MIYVDSSFWYALGVPRDHHHESAQALWSDSSGTPVATSTGVVGETWTLLNSRFGHSQAVQFIDSLNRSRRALVHAVDEAIDSEAWGWLRHHDERRYSYVDATSFALMRKLGITEALAFDGDFAAAGFTELRP